MKSSSPCYEWSTRLPERHLAINDTLVLPLIQSEPPPLSLVGGKALNLMRLTEAGMAVPAGFCVTTRAYEAFIERNGLDRVLRDSMCSLEDGDRGARFAASQRIRGALLSGVMQDDVTEAITRHYRELSGSNESCRVAVRSSATAEDLADASYAGAHATLLNVRGLPALLDAVRICWASLWMEQVATYRCHIGAGHGDVAIAVVVQKMIDSKVSGVLFTIDPVTGDRDCLTIEACWGLGESLVSGKTLPDHFELDRRNFRVCTQIYGRQREMVECAEEGIRTVALEDSLRRRPCLNTNQLHCLGRVALAIEEQFASPQDIEWAIEANSGDAEFGAEGIYVLQSRPVTVLVTRSAPAASDEPWKSPVREAVWVRRSGGVVEHLPGPASPLFASAQLPLICARLDAQCPEMGVITPPPTYALINGYFFNRSDYRLGLGAPLLPFNYWRAARKGARDWRHRALPDQETALAALSEFDLSRATVPQLLWHIQELLSFNAMAWDNAIRASRTYVLTEPLFRRIFERFIQPVTGGDALTFLCGFESQAMAGEHRLWELTESARLLPAIGERLRSYSPEEAWERIAADRTCLPWAQRLTEYCRRFGHVGASLDYLHRTMFDTPSIALRSIRVRLEARSENPLERLHKLALEREIATAQTLRELRSRRLRRRVFQWALSWAQEGASTREDIFFFAFRGWPVARRAILHLGNVLVEAGALTVPEDIFFLTWEELQLAVEDPSARKWQVMAADRRARHERQRSLTPPARIPLGGAPSTLRRKATAWLKRRLTGSVATTADDILWGAPVSPGVVTGPARIVHSFEESDRLHAGDILVTTAATPEWISAFAIAAGLVTDVGGPLSHGSIIAREFGIPAVMGVRVATTAIAEGQLITIDGAAGSIRLHEANG
jgi:rifampicin phosphotransferase